MSDSKLIEEMRAIRDGILGRGVRAIEEDRLTIELVRWSGDGRHTVTCSVTTRRTGEPTRQDGVSNSDQIRDAIEEFSKRADEVGAGGDRIDRQTGWSW